MYVAETMGWLPNALSLIQVLHPWGERRLDYGCIEYEPSW